MLGLHGTDAPMLPVPLPRAPTSHPPHACIVIWWACRGTLHRIIGEIEKNSPFIQKGCQNGQKEYEKIFSTISCQGNANLEFEVVF